MSHVVVEWEAGASLATALEELSVHVNEARRTRLLVQIVDILRAEKEAIAHDSLDCRQSVVSKIGFACPGLRAPLRIETPDDRGVRSPAFRGSNVLEAVLLPEAIGVPEGANPALGADPRARQHEDARVA
jgi:hypothetical protein